MYHSIDTPKLPRLRGIRVSPKNFDKQLNYFAKKGYKSYTLSEAILNRDSLDEKNLVITIDDGFRDNLTNALPILKKYNFKATIFVVINRFDNDWAVYRKSKNRGIVDKIEKLSDKDIEILLNSGLVEIGVHTLNHKNFSKLSKEEKIEEIVKSKEALEKRFNIEVQDLFLSFWYI